MSNVSEILKRMGGGVVEENGVTYVTHPNPPANDDSQKIATTAWVRDVTDSLEASVSGGMFPTVAAAGNRTPGIVPSSGTWWCYFSDDNHNVNGVYAGGATINGIFGGHILCIKIA